MVVTAALLAPAGVAVAAPLPVPCGNVAGVADFNGDRYDDAVVADPRAAAAGQAGAGAVYVRYGDGDGLVGEGQQVVLTQDSPLVLGDAGPGQRFGGVLALGKVDGDRCQDLVVAAQGNGALVQVIFGSPQGLGQGKPALTLLSTPRVEYAVGALDIAPANGSERAAVAIGLPNVAVAGQVEAGAVRVVGFTSAGEVAAATTFSDATPGVPGDPEPYAHLGAAVALGRIDGTAERYDLVAGAPGRDVGNAPIAGAVTVVTDVQVPAAAYAGELWDEESPGVPGVASIFDGFGGRLDFLQSGANGTLALGTPNDLVNARGSVQLFTSAGAGLVPSVQLTQDTPGVEGVVEAGDSFGQAVALADGKLAVGTYGDDVGPFNGAGSVQVFPLVDLTADVLYTQPGGVATGDRFGQAVSFAGGTHESAILVGVPQDTTATGGIVNVIPLDGSAVRAWFPNAGVEFGYAVKG